MKIGKARAEVLQVRFAPEQLEALRVRAREADMSRSDLVRGWVLERLGPKETRSLVELLPAESAASIDPVLDRLQARAMREGAAGIVRFELVDRGGPAVLALLEAGKLLTGEELAAAIRRGDFDTEEPKEP